MDRLTHFDDFIASLESMNIDVDTSVIRHSDARTINSVYGTVKSFIVDQNLVNPDSIASLESFHTNVRSFNSNVKLADIGPEQIIDLCKSCNVPEKYLIAAAESVSLCINNYTNGYDAATHFSVASPSAHHGDFEVRGLNTMYSDNAINALAPSVQSAVESFGADIATTISDAKVAITVSILRYHRSIIHRLIPNLPTESNMVTYKVDHMEVYDLTKSRSSNAQERYNDKHRVPFVDLYGDPSTANTQLKPIILRTANDGVGPAAKLVDENVVKIGVEVNMFDLSLDASQIGYSHVDYTDLVADSVRVKKLVFSVSDGTTTELIPVEVLHNGGSRLMMSANNLDSGDRVCNMNEITTMSQTTKTMLGANSVLLGGLTADALIKVKYNAAGSVNLKTSDAIVHGGATASIATVSGNPVIANDQTAFDGLTIKLHAYEMDAQFSEENIRKTTKAMRIMTKQVGYEIPGSSNYIVQYSLNQTKPESVIDGLTKLMSLGNDDRGVQLIMNSMKGVYDRLANEAALTGDNYVNKIGNNFVASQRVKPYIFLDTMTLDTNLKNMRSGEKWGDLRGYCEEYLLAVFSRMYRSSFYIQELGAGEKPVFSCLTSTPIKNSLLSVPHYHDHLGDHAEDKVADGVVEFRRTLPDGTVMNVISTNFRYFDDKIMIIPVRPNRPQSVLNFAQNRERGAYMTSATPTVDNSIFNALIGNSREVPIVTNPIGAIITIANLHEVFEGIGSLGL